jgi:hypothetical protein
MARSVVTLAQCNECATLVEVGTSEEYALCKRHRPRTNEFFERR